MSILNHRLFNQHLLGLKFTTPEEVVSWFGAVQSQDYQAAKWGVGMRIEQATDTLIDDAYNDGRILRTHVMRPTWHFVMPQDIRWMLKLTAPRVKMLMGTNNRKLGLTEEVFAKTNKEIVNALTGTYLTRQELKQVIEKTGIKTDVTTLAHLIMGAELDGLICSGPRRGKQFTYALMEERVTKVKLVSREESLARLATTYFQSHGPAQLKDFVWWSGLTVKDATEALDAISSQVASETIEEKTYYFSINQMPVEQTTQHAFLLSIFDEYTIAYKDRTEISDARKLEEMLMGGTAVLSVVILDGKVVGSWKRVLKKDRVEVSITPFRKFSTEEHDAIDVAINQYGEYLQLPVYRL